MTTLNRQRANLVYVSFRAGNSLPSPTQVAKVERIFEPGGMLYAEGRTPVGQCEIGVRLNCLFPMPQGSSQTPASSSSRQLLEIFSDEQYILWFSSSPSRRITTYRYKICLKKPSGPSDQLKAWIHALEFAHTVRATGVSGPYSDRPLELLKDSLKRVNDLFPDFLAMLVKAGWDVDKPALMTRPSFRISVALGEGAEEKKQK